MFSVKVTYNGEIRRFSFPDLKSFPTYEQLFFQLNRVFPSNNNYILSKLLFYPDASKPGRILIGSQICNIEAYNRCILPFRDRVWENASLRFTLLNGAADVGQGDYISQTVGQLPWVDDSNSVSIASQSAPNPFPLQLPTESTVFVPSSNDFSVPSVSRNVGTSSFPSPRAERTNIGPSWSPTAQAKKDIENIVKVFHQDLNHAVDRLSESISPSTNLPAAPPGLIPPSDSPFIPPLPPIRSAPYPPAISTSPLRTPPPPPVIHRGIICDKCDLTIEGIRHKCLDCPDYDLCTPCSLSGALESHNPQHQFLDITEPGRVIVHTVTAHQDRETRTQPQPDSPLVVHNASCDLCDSMIEGRRYSFKKCAVCPDFDTCESCFVITAEQHPNHSFVKLSKKEDYISRRSVDAHRHLARCDACNGNIIGIRYKCMHPDCPDFDLCERCESLPIPQHPFTHPLLKLRSDILPTANLALLNVTGRQNSQLNFSASDADASVTEAAPNETSLPSPFNPFNRTSLESRSPSPTLSYSLYPLSHPLPVTIPSPRLGQDDNQGEITTLEQPFLSEPEISNGYESDSSASPSHLASSPLIDIDDTPAVPGSWYGAGLNTLIDSSPEDANHCVDHIPFPVIRSPLVDEVDHHSISPCIEMRQAATQQHSLADLLSESHSCSDNLNSAGEPPRIDNTPLLAGYVQDVTVPDGRSFEAGDTFIKVWRMINNGSREWPVNTEVVFVGGAQLASGNPPPHIQPMCTVGPLKPNNQKNIWTPELKAPDVPGRYTSYWRLRDDNGQLFGDSIWVDIEVVKPLTETGDISMPSSSRMLMPDPTLSHTLANELIRSPTVDTEDSFDDTLSDSSSVSVVSMMCSEDDVDDTLWAESRVQGQGISTENDATHPSSGLDYVLLYDENTSDED
ncbi:hypothetical protein H0H93_011410 [Arthromyces matolae]|nr:hypothetical protein H0H93_011410 [Arthromyces matolae]